MEKEPGDCKHLGRGMFASFQREGESTQVAGELTGRCLQLS